jgi:hypothetical protein
MSEHISRRTQLLRSVVVGQGTPTVLLAALAVAYKRLLELARGKLGKRTVMLCMAMLLAVIAVSGTAYAVVTIRGTHGHDWGKDKKVNPPGCPHGCGKQIVGTNGDNKIYGLDGWDWIGPKAGNDVVYGGPGMEAVYGRSGRDRIHGGPGHDHLFGGDGNDKLFLQDGRDEPGHVEQAHGEGGRDYCVLDEDAREAIIVGDCETLVIKAVKGMKGATRLAPGMPAWERRDFVKKRFYPGTYRWPW